MTETETRGGRVAYHEQGSGFPVVLLHATLHDHRDFDPIIPTLARHYRTITLDWPGHGDSASDLDASPDQPPRGDSGPAAHPDASLLADVLEDVVAALDLPPAVFVGNSVGGFAAARLAIAQPDRVAGLVLVNSGGFLPQNVVTRTFCRTLGRPAIARRVYARFVKSYMKVKTPSDEAIVARAAARARTEEGAAIAASVWRSFGTAAYDLRARAGELRAPTLIVWGAKDTAIPLRAGRATHAALPSSELTVLDTGHVVFSSDPEGFLAVAEPFLQSIAQAAATPAPPAGTGRG